MDAECGRMCDAYDYDIHGLCSGSCAKKPGHLEAPHRCKKHKPS